MKRNPQLSIESVTNILGRNKVVTYEQAYRAFYQKIGKEAPTVRYTDETIRDFAEQNKSGIANWCLIYVLRISLSAQREIVGVDRSRQPSFYGNNWWLDAFWAATRPEADYVLIEMQGRLNRTNWSDQEENIGGRFQRAPMEVMSQALVSLYATHQERPLDDKYHWGPNEVARTIERGQERVAIGTFDPCVVHVCAFPESRSDKDDLFVYVTRKFDF